MTKSHFAFLGFFATSFNFVLFYFLFCYFEYLQHYNDQNFYHLCFKRLGGAVNTQWQNSFVLHRQWACLDCTRAVNECPSTLAHRSVCCQPYLRCHRGWSRPTPLWRRWSAAVPWPGAWRWTRRAPPGCSPAGRLLSEPTRVGRTACAPLKKEKAKNCRLETWNRQDDEEDSWRRRWRRTGLNKNSEVKHLKTPKNQHFPGHKR